MSASVDSPKILIFRLSALGDIILCSSAVTAIRRTRPKAKIHWVCSTTWASLLEQDSRCDRLVRFERRSGIFAWHRLCRQLFEERYDEVLDLHSSLRTRYARFYFWLRTLSGNRSSLSRWAVLSKSRARRLGFFLFKSAWPQRLRPDHEGGLATRAALLAGGSVQDRPDLSFLLKQGGASQRTQDWIQAWGPRARGFLSVMPGSAWPGKRWPIARLADSLCRIGLPVAIVGTERDRECWALSELLERAGLPVLRAFQSSDFSQTASLIHASRLLISNDTGLVHLAEAVGKPVVQIFGPTDPALGFGAWRPESRVVASSLWCRPCSKDGSACFRLGSSRYLCMQQLSPDQVVGAVQEVLGSSLSGGEAQASPAVVDS
jgi:ADP-heptose:LPS heptosyltransferase